MTHSSYPSLSDLRQAICLACQSQGATLIVQGRERVLAMPRAWVVRHFHRVARKSLNLTDYWEYRRLLELAQLIDGGIVKEVVAIGLSSQDPDIREAAGDFSADPDADTGRT